MLVMHSDAHSSSSPALPTLLKREASRSLGWRPESHEIAQLPDLKPPQKTKVVPAKCKPVFVCTEVHCGKTFPRSFALRRHMRIHTGTKPYACDYEGCLQRFNTSGNLSRHKRIHSGERPYPCIFDICGKRFNTSTKLKRHLRIHFPEGQNLFRCLGNCNWSCENYKKFTQHQKLHHNVIVGQEAQKDNECFDTTRSFTSEQLSQHSSSSFLFANSVDKHRNKLLCPSPFFGASDLSNSIPTMLHKDETTKKNAPDMNDRRFKSGAFPSAQYSSSAFSDNSFSRATYSGNHLAPLRPEDEREHYEQSHQHQVQLQLLPSHHALRPPPQNSEDGKFGGFAVPPPMNPAAPEFTGEELSVVLQLMNDNNY